MNRTLLIVLVGCLQFIIQPRLSAAETIDAIVATVDEHPILLSDLNRFLQKQLSMSEASDNPAAREALDRLIFDTLINNEAEVRRVNVTDADIERYVDEVAQRNNLSRSGFVDALKAQGKDWQTYQSQVRSDILQTRLASIMLQGQGTVKEEELNRYIEEHPGLLKRGASITIRRLVTSTLETAEQYASKKYSDDDFEEIVKEHSLAADASNGGLLGTISERDLSPEIFSALMHTQPEHTSSVVTDTSGGIYTVYFVKDRSNGTPEEIAAMREQIKQRLSQAKLAQSMEGLFQTELYKNHTIDKKI